MTTPVGENTRDVWAIVVEGFASPVREVAAILANDWRREKIESMTNQRKNLPLVVRLSDFVSLFFHNTCRPRSATVKIDNRSPWKSALRSSDPALNLSPRV